MRTKKPAGSARSRILRRLSTALALSTSSPSCVSFSEMLRSMPDATIASMTLEVLARRGVGLGEAGDALAEQVERDQHAARLDGARRLDRFGDGLAGDEAPREARRPAHAVRARPASSGCRFARGGGRRLWTRCRASSLMRPAGRREQVLDRPRVVPQHGALAHAEAPALGDDDAAGLERLGRLVDRLPSAGHAEVGVARGELLDQPVDARSRDRAA